MTEAATVATAPASEPGTATAPDAATSTGQPGSPAPQLTPTHYAMIAYGVVAALLWGYGMRLLVSWRRSRRNE